MCQTFMSYVHIPKEQRKKWDENSVKCIMVGYSEGNKAYRVYKPEGRRIWIRRDVIFNEVNQPQIVTEKSRVQSVMPEPSSPVERDETPCEVFQESQAGSPKPKYKNPRLPIPKFPYQTRRGSRESERDNEEEAGVVIAETYMVNAEPVTLEEALEADDAEKWHQAVDKLN